MTAYTEARFCNDEAAREYLERTLWADGTYFGKRDVPHVSPQRKGRPFTKGGKRRNDRPIVALVERGGKVRTFHVAVADKVTVTKIVRDNIVKESRLHTDESNLYLGS